MDYKSTSLELNHTSKPMPFDDFPPTYPNTDLSLEDLVKVIKLLPQSSPKWQGVTPDQLSQLFIVKDDRIVVLCKTSHDKYKLKRCIITPSKDEEATGFFGVPYINHDNAEIKFFYKNGGSGYEFLFDAEKAIKSLGDILWPELRIDEPERPLFNAYQSYHEVPGLDASCVTTERIWQYLTFYNIPFRLESKDQYSRLILQRFDRNRFDTAVISPRTELRNGDVLPAAIYVSRGSYPITITDSIPFTSLWGLIQALIQVGAVAPPQLNR